MSGLSTVPASLHPLTGAELVRNYILAMMQRPLMAHDPDWNLVCLLCTTVPTIPLVIRSPADRLDTAQPRR